MKAHSIKGRTPEEIKKKLEKIISGEFNPTLAVVFVSIQQDIKVLISILEKYNLAVFGATSGGEIMDSEFMEGSIVILLCDMEPAAFKVFFNESPENQIRKAAQKIAKSALELFSDPMFIVLGSGLAIDGELILRGIEDIAGKDSTIYGGMAADELQFKEPVVFNNHQISKCGILVWVIDGQKFNMAGRASCGWKASGTVKTVTRSDGWWILEIDNQPALDLIKRYLGLDIPENEKIMTVMPDQAANFPLQLQRSKGEPIMRPPLLINWEERSVMLNGRVEEGSKIRLSVPPDFEVIDMVIDDCSTVKDNELSEADAIIMFSCVGRLAAFGPLIKKEIAGINEIYKAPMVGFFSYGEFGRATNGNHEYHNLTCCWVAIKET